MSDAAAEKYEAEKREGNRLRAAGFTPVIELNGRLLWERAGASYWHEQALEALNDDLPPAA